MSKRVLIVDDARIIRALIKNALTLAGYEVVGEAQSGQEAVYLFGQLKPDLVTMDLIMPDMQGMEAIKRIISIDPKARIIVVSSLGQKLLAQDAIEAGAQAFLAKPFQPSDLISLANEIMDKKAEVKPSPVSGRDLV